MRELLAIHTIFFVILVAIDLYSDIAEGVIHSFGDVILFFLHNVAAVMAYKYIINLVVTL